MFRCLAAVSLGKSFVVKFGNQHFSNNRGTILRVPLSLTSLSSSILRSMSDKKFCVEYAKRGTAGCKKCKVKIDKGLLRIAKLVSNPFSDSGGDMKQWYHAECLFETFEKARATTKIIEETDDLDGWDDVQPDDRKKIVRLIDSVNENRQGKAAASPRKATKQQKLSLPAATTNASGSGPPAGTKKVTPKASTSPPAAADNTDPGHKDNSFRQFRQLCARVAEDPSHKRKAEIINVFITKGTGGDGFKGNLSLWTRLLLPGVVKRVYNLQSKQLAKLFGQIFGVSQEEMIEDLEQGDVAETVRVFFEQSSAVRPAKKSLLSIQDVDKYLEELSGMTREEDQQSLLKKVAVRCTGNDLKMFVRLIKADLRINAGAKHVLDGVHPDAYEAFQASRDLDDVLERVSAQLKSGQTGTLEIGISLMTPVLPMLAEACKSVEYAMKKCPNGMFSEIKYDGERVQLHKKGPTFAYFSRSLKPVQAHKVKQFKDFIPQAFPHGENMILDAEVLLIDTTTGKPLPFGTLGVHKKTAFKDANVCLFVFDILHLNGENLMKQTITNRRKILEKHMTEIPNRIMFSEMKKITKSADLSDMISSVIRQGLEGLVLKDTGSIYEPGKRHWLKVKKDYLANGAVADSADLVVLGAWFGTGNKGGMMSVFLMGCWDGRKWRTVTKVGNGHDDATLDRLQHQLKMTKISRDPDLVPAWLDCSKTMIPDFVIQNPKQAPVWEITGAEFTKHGVHTAAGISIRFPRVTKIRDDKSWDTATSLQELVVLYENSKQVYEDEGSGSAATSSAASSPSKRPTSGDESSAKSTPVKRSAEDSDGQDEVSPKKRFKPTSAPANSKAKPSNLFGCKAARASSKPGNKADDSSKSPAASLPDTFRPVQAVLSSRLAGDERLRRYIIAYDGEVLPSEQLAVATHYIAAEGESVSEKVRCSGVAVVSEGWVWDAVKLGRLPPTRPYSAA